MSAAAIQRSAKISAKCQIKQVLNYSKTTALQSGIDVRSATIFSHQDTIIVKVRNETMSHDWYLRKCKIIWRNCLHSYDNLKIIKEQ